MTTITHADVLMEAARLIETRGHCRFQAGDASGRLCTIGAICAAAGCMQSRIGPAHVAMQAAMAPGVYVYQWSDATDTPTVISTIRAVAAIERAKLATVAAPGEVA